jgi:hypothetical protein
MSTDARIKLIKHSLKEMAFEDIRRASAGGAKMGAFILASCFIDYLAGFYAGHKANADEYRAFITDFLSGYDPDKLYRDFRCGVVHNYTEGGSYVFTDGEKAGKHLTPLKDGRVLLNLEHFVDDIEKAMQKYFNRLDVDTDVVKKALKRLGRGGILSVGPVQ